MPRMVQGGPLLKGVYKLHHGDPGSPVHWVLANVQPSWTSCMESFFSQAIGGQKAFRISPHPPAYGAIPTWCLTCEPPAPQQPSFHPSALRILQGLRAPGPSRVLFACLFRKLAMSEEINKFQEAELRGWCILRERNVRPCKDRWICSFKNQL